MSAATKATTATTSWWETDYPARYYAKSSSPTLGGYPSVGWVDVNLFSSKPDDLPTASDMIALTDDEWNARSYLSQIIKDGKVQTYFAPAATADTGTSGTTAASATSSTTSAATAT